MLHHLAGGSLGQNKTGGQFSTEESRQHINILELKAARFGLRALCKNEFSSHILIRIDNTSAASAINKIGSVKSIEMDNEVHLTWEFISTQNNWLTTTHIPGIFNEDADRDRESRKQELRTEWMLDRRDFYYVTKKLSFSIN